jgi:hypothetical protein
MGSSVSSMESSVIPLTDALIAKSSWDSLKATMLPFFFPISILECSFRVKKLEIICYGGVIIPVGEELNLSHK